MSESLGCEWRSATKLKKVITHSCDSRGGFGSFPRPRPGKFWQGDPVKTILRMACVGVGHGRNLLADLLANYQEWDRTRPYEKRPSFAEMANFFRQETTKGD